MTTEHTDYGMLAGRFVVAILHKETKDTFSGNKTIFLFDANHF